MSALVDAIECSIQIPDNCECPSVTAYINCYRIFRNYVV